MGKKSELSIEVRAEIVTKYNCGISVKDICEEYDLSRQTVHYQINKHKKTNSVQNLARTGRKRKTTSTEDRHIIYQFTKNPTITPKYLASQLQKYSDDPVSERTIRRRLTQHSFGTYVIQNIPYISAGNKVKRLEFARKYVDKPPSFWNRVLWTDESSFEYHGSQKKTYVRLPKETRKKLAPVSERMSHGGGSVMFWGCISSNGAGDLVPIDGTMNRHKYLDILDNHAFQSGDKIIGESFIFQQDNAPCHKSRMVMQFLIGSGVEILDWPPQSPDLNVIENVWSYIKAKRSVSLTRTREETISEVKGLWEEVPPEMFSKLVDSVPKRLRNLIDSKGGYIFY